MLKGGKQPSFGAESSKGAGTVGQRYSDGESKTTGKLQNSFSSSQLTLFSKKSTKIIVTETTEID